MQESTIGAAFLTQTLAVNETTVKFEIWDTAGQERYHSLAPMYYRGAAAAIIVYDITNAVCNFLPICFFVLQFCGRISRRMDHAALFDLENDCEAAIYLSDCESRSNSSFFLSWIVPSFAVLRVSQ